MTRCEGSTACLKACPFKARPRTTAFVPAPTTGSFPARTPHRASRCCRTTCISTCASPTSGTRRTSPPETSTWPASPCRACRLSSSGHNRYIAWGFTNLGPNVEDVYIEKFNDKGEYLTPQGWVQPEHRKEIIRGQGQAGSQSGCRDHAARSDHHRHRSGREAPTRAEVGHLRSAAYPARFSLTWTRRRTGRSSAPRSRTSARPGRTSSMPTWMDTSATRPRELIPIRAAGDGSVPVPGDDDSHEWTGYVPFDQLPSVYDPPSGIIATANGRVTPDGYPYLLSIEWMAPYRTERIYKLLNARKKFTPADMLAIQTDILSEFDRYCAERFVYAVDHTPKASQRAKAGCRPDAQLGRHHDDRLSRADHRLLLAQEAGGAAAQAQTGRRVERVSVVHESGVAGERAGPSARALAAGRLRQLRRTADRRRASRGGRCGDSALAWPCGSGGGCIAWTFSIPSGATFRS